MEEKSLEIIIKKESFFKKILNKFKNLFNKKEKLELNSSKVSDIENTKKNIMDSIKVSDSYKELLSLQKDIENEEISIADISEEMAEKLIKLYEIQNV